MDEQDHGFPVSGDALTQAAIQAANRCHAPYSHSPSGVALELKDGTIFSGIMRGKRSVQPDAAAAAGGAESPEPQRL